MPGECHLWHLPLREPEDGLLASLKRLPVDEQKRADAFLLPEPRRQFILVRRTLRQLLGSYLNLPGEHISFCLNAFGKPSLPPPQAGLHFNVSHSGEHALIALSRDAAVGVDIEQHREFSDMEGMAGMIWCQQDIHLWQQLPLDQRIPAFYRAWTCKEAISKALGRGLTLDFKRLRVGFSPDEDARIIAMDPSCGEIGNWTLLQLGSENTCSAALAIASAKVTARFFALQP